MCEGVVLENRKKCRVPWSHRWLVMSYLTQMLETGPLEEWEGLLTVEPLLPSPCAALVNMCKFMYVSECLEHSVLQHYIPSSGLYMFLHSLFHDVL